MSKVAVSIGDQVYLKEDGASFGSVRHITPNELTVDIENHGDVTIDAASVRAVHDGKVVLDVASLPADVRRAITRAHSGEDPA